MTVTIELPDHVAAELESVEQQSDVAKTYPLTLPKRVASAVAYSLFSCRDTEQQTEVEHYIDLALNLVAMQQD